MNIVLIGYRGTGKSTVAKIIAKKLGTKVVSTDEAIVKKAGMRIPQIVENKGWDGFRDIESEVIREVAAQDNIIIDAGGGVIVRQENIDNLRASGIVFWLTAKIESIVRRIQGDTERPSLTGEKSFTDEVAEVLKQREPLYKAAAHHVVATEKSPQKVADQIMKKLKSDKAKQR